MIYDTGVSVFPRHLIVRVYAFCREVPLDTNPQSRLRNGHSSSPLAQITQNWFFSIGSSRNYRIVSLCQLHYNI